MTRPVFTQAALSVGETSTEYLRAGQGSTVLLLVAGGAESALALRLVAVLSRWWRVIAPKWPAGDTVLPSTLEEFIEGLGIAPTAIVAEGEFCAAALDLAAASDDVTVVALLTSADEAGALEAAARTRLAGRRVTVIVRPVPAIDTGLTAFARELVEAMDTGRTHVRYIRST